MPQTDTWKPSASDNPTHTFSGAGVTLWKSVNIENDTSFDLYVNNSASAIPSPTSFWRKVPAHGNVTLPLNGNGVSYYLNGTVTAAMVTAGVTIQTVLSETDTGATGNTGTVNVESGTIFIGAGSTVNVQTATGVSLVTTSREDQLASVTIPASGGSTAGPFTLATDATSIILESNSSIPVIVRVLGGTTGAFYWAGTIEALGVWQVPVDPVRDPTIQVFVQHVTATIARTLTISESTGPAYFNATQLYPYSQLASLQYGVKNVNTIDVSGKNFFNAAIASAAAVTLIPATPNTAWALYDFVAIPDAAVAWLSVVVSSVLRLPL
jgi:hypothetical protein